MDFEVFSRIRAEIQKSVKKYAFGKTFSQIAESERVKSNKLNYCVQKTSFEKRVCRYSNCVIFSKSYLKNGGFFGFPLRLCAFAGERFVSRKDAELQRKP